MLRRRLTTKTPAAEVASPATTKTVAPCGDWTLEYLHSIRQQYKAKNPRRQITSTDLPKPPAPEGWTEVTRCWFCREVFDSAEARNKHVRACGSMPYNLWSRRVRILQYDARHSLFSCQHCGTQLYTAKAKKNHPTESALFAFLSDVHVEYLNFFYLTLPSEHFACLKLFESSFVPLCLNWYQPCQLQLSLSKRLTSFARMVLRQQHLFVRPSNLGLSCLQARRTPLSGC